MQRESSAWYPRETGGVVAGYVEGAVAYIRHAVGPGPRAVHRRRSFCRDSEYAEEQVNAIYERSHGLYDYLGEWHSHARTQGPSPIDTGSMLRISRTEEYGRPDPLLIICMCERRKWSFHAYGIVADHLAELSLTVEEVT